MKYTSIIFSEPWDSGILTDDGPLLAKILHPHDTAFTDWPREMYIELLTPQAYRGQQVRWLFLSLRDISSIPNRATYSSVCFDDFRCGLTEWRMALNNPQNTGRFFRISVSMPAEGDSPE